VHGKNPTVDEMRLPQGKIKFCRFVAMVAVNPKQPDGLIPAARCILRSHDQWNNSTFDACLPNVGKELGLSVFEVSLFGKNAVRIDCVDFFAVGSGGAPGKCHGGFAFPTADFDNDTVALIELPQFEKAIDFSVSEHAG